MSDSNEALTLPRVVDALKLVAAGANVQGECALDRMMRLDLDRSSGMPPVRVSLQFSRKLDGTRLAEGRIEAILPRICQRCLAAMREDVRCEPVWALAKTDEEAVELDARYEAVLRVDHPLDLWEAVEDELLLVAAMAPTHADAADCDPAFTAVGGADTQTSAGKLLPFTMLRRLKQDSV